MTLFRFIVGGQVSKARAHRACRIYRARHVQLRIRNYSPGFTSDAERFSAGDAPSCRSASTFPARLPGIRPQHPEARVCEKHAQKVQPVVHQQLAASAVVYQSHHSHNGRISLPVRRSPSLIMLAERRKGAPFSGRARSDITWSCNSLELRQLFWCTRDLLQIVGGTHSLS